MCDKQAFRNMNPAADAVPAFPEGRPGSCGKETGDLSHRKRRQLLMGSFRTTTLSQECLLPMHSDDRSALLAWIRAKRERELQC